MILRRRSSPRDRRGHESVAGKVVHHDYDGGYTYVRSDNQAVIRGLKQRGFTPVAVTEAPTPVPVGRTTKSPPKKARSYRQLPKEETINLDTDSSEG